MNGENAKGGCMSADKDDEKDDELERHIWKEDRIIVNGQQLTIMYPPAESEES